MISYAAPKLKNMIKVYLPTWSIFAGLVTYVAILIQICKIALIFGNAFTIKRLIVKSIS